MKRIFLFFVIIFTFITCSPSRHVSKSWENVGVDGDMIEVFNDKVDSIGFVEICLKDTVSTDLSDWLEMGFYSSDYKLTKQWIYIKDTDTNKVYVLTMKPDSTYYLDIRSIIIDTNVEK